MIIERDVPIPTDDGVVLRADVFRPDTSSYSSSKERVPVILVQGPYGKGVDYKIGYADKWKWLTETHPNVLANSTHSFETWETVDPEIWVPWGYACVRVDSRGTGRTPGKLDIFSPREIKDFYQAIEWAGVQPWSNGKVGLLGISYYAISQWLVASLQPPHLAAMIPWEGASDFYRDFIRHGGILSNNFHDVWFKTQVLTNQHGNPDGYLDHWMDEKATGPQVLTPEELAANRVDAVEEAVKKPTIDSWYLERSASLDKIAIPFLSAANLGGFGLHQRGNFEPFWGAASKQKWLRIHAGRHDESFYLDEGMAMQKRFLDHFLKGEENGWEQERPVMLQIRRPNKPFGEFRKYASWPLPDTNWTKFYLHASNQSLSLASDVRGSAQSFAAQSSNDIVFTTPPLEDGMALAGPIALKLHVSSSTTDADLFVTLQAFSPAGEEVVFQGANEPRVPLSQGWLRASHRKLDPVLSRPYRPYLAHDELQPLTPNQVYAVDVELWPTQIELPAGYRLSLRIGGADFARPVGTFKDASPFTGSGPFLHNHPADRDRDEFKGTTSIWTGDEHQSWVLLPLVAAWNDDD